ncbi:MAG: DUF5615 family PIN-like protein [Phormidium sp. BM_Day4_Bin.17]|nr:DUF5615 family PIN-like protein [Phormidium sp. BM_Day4_Bin.17]UCJ12488.1 MAG: DUF5615 family PIN-like protein [Phormidium sp. PBR-2020]
MIRHHFYSDENIPLILVDKLRDYGHDILTCYDVGQANRAISDSQVLEFATAANRAVITLNRQDFIHLHRENMTHAGIIICKTDRNHVSQARHLHESIFQIKTLHNRLFRILKINQPGQHEPTWIFREYGR